MIKRSKYRNVKVEFAGIKFDSKMELKRYHELLLLIEAGEITDLHMHTKFPIEINGIKVCNVINDFDYIEVKTGKFVSEDCKGFDTPVSRLKRKLIAAFYPRCEWRVITKKVLPK